MRPLKEGDIVQVDFHNAKFTLCEKGEILNVPCATGDSWVIKDTLTGTIYYISEGCTISKYETRQNNSS